MSQDGRREGGGGGGQSGAGGCGGGGAPGSPQSRPITLALPRPDHQRATNLYVDTPFQHRVAPRRPAPPHAVRTHHQDLPLVHAATRTSTGKRGSKPPPATTPTSATTTIGSGSVGGGGGSRVVTKQPAALTFTKGGREESEGESIICAACGRCRCQACRRPRPPPAAWLCRDTCLCSPAAAVDYASCLCCVKCVLYHCGKDGAGGLAAAADHPCSCGGGRGAMLGWACMALAALPLPCLLCYWPLTGVRRLVEAAYQRCTSHGCRCPQGRPPRLAPPPPPLPPQLEKRGVQEAA